ncbi:cyclin-dependent kinase inhibitor 3-like isoform X2 [Corticium candelabrum]|uniref:cyclin-dependent kinase inhibitor 3-like isoform X2 n=1 Tax=Corticium candelabrum TaxID=121492 RepID=UPI002E26E169|nr:cyclin-dependent kinase inhibitor 3-like isoform X2 [Corticium candelabrum]
MVFLPANDFDSSDEEEGEGDQEKLDISWISLPGCEQEGRSLAISPLPGFRFGERKGSVAADVEDIMRSGVDNVFVLCTSRELQRYGVPSLLHEFSAAGLCVNHHPIEDGSVPSTEECGQLLQQLMKSLTQYKQVLIHCFNGLGRSCLVVALLIMLLDDSVTGDDVLEKVRSIKGPGAVQTVRQYNMIQEFRKIIEENPELFSGISSPLSSPVRAESR